MAFHCLQMTPAREPLLASNAETRRAAQTMGMLYQMPSRSESRAGVLSAVRLVLVCEAVVATAVWTLWNVMR